MAESKLEQLNTIIQQAQNTLNTAFGSEKDLDSVGAFKFLDQNELAEAYKTEISLDVIEKQFAEISDSIKKMRSSYLPIDFFKNPFDGTFSEDIANTVAEIESYENTFMRMLGMPMADEVSYAESLIMVNPDGTEERVSFEEAVSKILDERQKKQSERRVLINDLIYDVALSSISIPDEEADEELSDTEEKQLKTTIPSINNMEDDFFSYCYLLIPPFQDHRISKCINEPNKIIPLPFSNKNAKIINQTKLKPSLLESVIRIRLDRLSGTNTFIDSERDVEEIGASVFISNEISGEDIPVTSDSYGLLESLFIIRIYSAISGLAKKMKRDIDDIITQIDKTQLKILQSRRNSGAAIEDDSTAPNFEQDEESEDAESVISESEKLLQTQKLVEDAILSLLEDKEEAIDLQVQTQRMSSVHNAHLMSSILGVIDVPRKRIEQDLAKLKKVDIDNANLGTSRIREAINNSLGIATGVGTIDVAVYSLAMFSAPEEVLLGLLTDAQYERLKNGTFKELIPGSGEKMMTLDAINEFSGYIIAGYRLFKNELESELKA